jgi:hypothetical protein
MARSYGDKFIRELTQADGTKLGVQLGRLCVDNNLPASYVAVALETTPTTIYSWFRGQGIREHKRKIVEVFIDLVRQDCQSKRLPAKSIPDAKRYIESMLGVTL